jgi:hypothetical protein
MLGLPFFPPFLDRGGGRERLEPAPRRKYAYTPDLIALVLGQRTTKKPVNKLYGGEERRFIYVSEKKTKRQIKGRKAKPKVKKQWWQSKIPL